MKTIFKLKFLVGFYLSILLVLLLCVVATPLAIQHGLSMTRTFMIEEETLETVLILFIFMVFLLL